MNTVTLADLQSARRVAIVGPKAAQSAMLRHIQRMAAHVDPDARFAHVVKGALDHHSFLTTKTVPVVHLGPGDGSAMGGTVAAALASLLANDDAPPPLRKALLAAAGREDVRAIVLADSECLPSTCADGCFDAVLFLPGAVTANGAQRMWRQWIGVGCDDAGKLAPLFDACLCEDSALVWRGADVELAKMRMPPVKREDGASSSWWFW